MTTPATRTTMEAAKGKLTAGKDRLNTIRSAAAGATPELENNAREIQDALDSALAVMDSIVSDDVKWWPTVRRFIRRLFSREFIIAVVSILAIWLGGLEAEQAIGVAVAGGGLALGRGVAKARTGGTDG